MKKYIVLLLVLILNFGLLCHAQQKQDKPKPPSQSTSKENKIRKQNFDLCVQSGKNRSYCYYLYY